MGALAVDSHSQVALLEREFPVGGVTAHCSGACLISGSILRPTAGRTYLPQFSGPLRSSD
ncbi:MAG: hypothetical protein CMM07_02800 [Rhodopirellula sp.]|nr:hypothetical protein [Rhodopirellula sp.]